MLQNAGSFSDNDDNKLSVEAHFSTPIYTLYRPDFLDRVKKVSKARLKEAKQRNGFNELFPVLMSGNFFDDPSISDFVEFVGSTSWSILNEQGYAMQDMAVQFTEMWTQEHHQHSLMEQHTHRFGSQIVGFYFLDVPPEAPRALFYDPRMGKIQGSMPEANFNALTLASSLINYEPRPGLFIFTNSWLAHSFTKNISKKPFRFVHFNLTVSPVQQQVEAMPATGPSVEVI